MLKNIAIFSILFVLALFSGCNDSNNGQFVIQTPAVQKITQLELLDASGNKLPENSTIGITSLTDSSGALKKSISMASTVNADGFLTLESLPSGNYKLTVTVDGKVVVTFLEVSPENYQAFVSVVAPLIVDQGNVTVIDGAIIAAISGTVHDYYGEGIEGAQVSVSGGAKTNGAIATAITDENGAYKLLVNVSKENLVALLNATIYASADGYASKSVKYKVNDLKNYSGVNISLGSAPSVSLYYSEDFENGSTGWTTNKLAGSNENNAWNLHSTSKDIFNKSYINNLVKLAPNDITEGLIPNPISGSACFWYGNPDGSDKSTGSFIDVVSNDYNLSGGTSVGYNSGELISPSIDLTNVIGYVNLSFKTWWEIESVNPNAYGFDLMTISVSDDDGATWIDLARLNPLSDPQSAGINRAPIPFSNTGFNNAPKWLQQEGISLVDANGNTLAGKSIKLKYTFNTVDGLYNGFRGWMIDDIEIKSGEGTFPLLSNGSFDVYADMPEFSFYVADVLPSSYSADGSLVALTSGVSQAFEVGLDYFSTEDVTFKLQLRDTMTDKVLVDNIASEDVPAKTFSLFGVSNTYAAPTLNTRNSIKKAVTSSSAVNLSGTATIPKGSSGSISLWVVMSNSFTGIIKMKYPVEFYEVN